MKDENILDYEEEASTSLFGNQALYCVGTNFFLLWIISLVMDYVVEGTFKTVLVLSVLIGTAMLTLIGAYWAIKGIRMKEQKQWPARLGLFGNFIFGLLFLLILTFAIVPHQSGEPRIEEPVLLE